MAVAQDVPVRGGRLHSRILVSAEKVLGDLTVQAGAQADQPFVRLSEQFLVDAGFVVESLEITEGTQPDEVSVTLDVSRKEDDVLCRLSPPAGVAVETAPGRERKAHNRRWA